MADVLLSQLENSAKILLAPPNVVSSDQRHLAESIFINFKKTKSPFALCKYIFENGKIEYVLYQAAALLKESLIREWRLIPRNDIESLRSYLMQYVLEKKGLPSYVREQILQVIAIMVKRSSIDGIVEDKEYILTEVRRLISSGNNVMQTIGCSILTTLLNEYASTIKSSDVGLTWEVHFQAKKSFEVTELKKIFEFCLQALYELEKCEHPSKEFLTLLNRFLIIMEQVLSWNFIYSNLPKKLIGVFEADQSPSFRPGSTWRELLMNRNVLDLFFKLHWKVRSHSEIMQHSINCLIQLATLHGTIFVNKDARIQYFSCFLEGLLRFMQNCVNGQEALGIANIINKLVLFFPAPVLVLTSKELLEQFMSELTKLTCKFIQYSVQEEGRREDCFYSEAFDRLLEAWVTIFHDIQLFPSAFSKQASAEIVNAYLQCHLAPPEGTRIQNVSADNEDIFEVEDDDRIKYREQLSVIAMLGRHSMDHIIPLLIRLMESRIQMLQENLQKIHQQVISSSDTNILHNLYEDIHWIILVIGHTLSLDHEGETSLIPPEIMYYSLSQSATVDIDSTLKVLTSPSTNCTNKENVDQVVRLIAAMFWISDMELQALKANMIHVLSPELSSTIMWFFRRWSLSFLLPNETYYSEISPALNAAFGRDSESGMWCLNFLLNKIEFNLSNWSSEPKVIIDTVNLLVALVDNRDRGSRVAKCESLWLLIQKQSHHNLFLLPSEAKRGLLKALVLAGMIAKENDVREQYWMQVLKPLQDKFKDLICQENFTRIFHEEIVKKEIIHLLDCFTGVVQGCEVQNVQFLFPFLHPIISEFVSLLNVYHNYQEIVEQIFHFLCECTKRMLCFLNPSDSKLLYDCCLSMIQVYAKFNTGKQSSSSTAEEEQYEDILLLMELLTNLLSKDFIDFSPVGESLINDSNTLSAADITLCGLNIIMPMMNSELLKFPRLCLQYFKMITFVCEIYPYKICQLPQELFKNLIISVELGLANFGSDIMMLCLDFLTGLGTHMVKSQLRNNFMYWSMKPFLKIVLNIVLLQNFDLDLLQTASGTLFVLICLYQDQYQELVTSLLRDQTDPAYYQRLATAFNSLMLGIQLTDARMNKIKFRENFEKFVAEVRGFLCVK